MAFTVRTTKAGRQDVADIISFLLRKESVERASAVMLQLEAAIARLAELPSCGRVPPELKVTGETEIREIRVKPWCIVYEVQGRVIWVLAIVDGRRNVGPIIQERMLRARTQ